MNEYMKNLNWLLGDVINESTIDDLTLDAIKKIGEQKKHFNLDSSNKTTYIKMIADRILRVDNEELRHELLKTIGCDLEVLEGLSLKDQINIIKQHIYEFVDSGKRVDLIYTFSHILGINSF